MTPEQRVAADDWWQNDGPDWKQIRKDAGLPRGSEAAIIEGYHYALREHAADLALAAAVGRLDDCIYTIQHFDDWYTLSILDGDLHAGEWSAPTLTAAINAALDDRMIADNRDKEPTR